MDEGDKFKPDDKVVSNDGCKLKEDHHCVDKEMIRLKVYLRDANKTQSYMRIITWDSTGRISLYRQVIEINEK